MRFGNQQRQSGVVNSRHLALEGPNSVCVPFFGAEGGAVQIWVNASSTFPVFSGVGNTAQAR